MFVNVNLLKISGNMIDYAKRNELFMGDFYFENILCNTLVNQRIYFLNSINKQ